MDKIGALIDLDGTIYRGSHVIEGAPAFIEKLKKLQIPFLFVTNNSSRTPEAVVRHLKEMSIHCDLEQVCTTAQAAADFISAAYPNKTAFVIGEEGLRSALQKNKIEMVENQPDLVVQGIDRQFHYEQLKKAVGLIRSGCPYILTNPDLLLPSDHEYLPGAGAISAAICASAQVKPTIIGKPSPIVMNYALQRIGLKAEQVWVIGDSVRTDVAAGNAIGSKTALILSGVTQPSTLKAECEEAKVTPDLVCSTLSEWLQQLTD